MHKKGFTLLELLVVVAIIGILAAIAIPNLLYAVQRAKQRRTMLDMKNMALAWEARNTEMSRYNAAGAAGGGGVSYEGCDQKVNISDVVTALTPTYIRSVPRFDAWGNLFACYLDEPWGSSNPAQKYVIISGGHDGKIDTEAQSGAITNFDCDIVYGSGRFLSYPDGITLK